MQNRLALKLGKYIQLRFENQAVFDRMISGKVRYRNEFLTGLFFGTGGF